jgi:hypothetical protein
MARHFASATGYGRQSYAERNPNVVAMAKKLARYPVNGHRRSLRDVAAELESQGHLLGVYRLRLRTCNRDRTPSFGAKE